MNYRGIPCLIVVLVVLAGLGLAREQEPEKGQWVSLFDGKTLNGWSVHSGFAKYRVPSSARRSRAVPTASSAPTGNMATLFWSSRSTWIPV